MAGIAAEQLVVLQRSVGDTWRPADVANVLDSLQQPADGGAAGTPTDLLILTRVQVNARFGTNFGDRSFNALQQAIRRRRLDCHFPGAIPAGGGPRIVFTAPHTLALLRDNSPQHAREDYTGTLARRFANLCGGGYVTWTEEERRRVQALPAADASNRDPNFLTNDELSDSVWFHALLRQRERFVPMVFGNDPPGAMNACLHVDVHGMRDPPAHPVDLMVGSAAMRRRFGAGRPHAVLGRIATELRAIDVGPPLAAMFEVTFGLHPRQHRRDRRVSQRPVRRLKRLANLRDRRLALIPKHIHDCQLKLSQPHLPSHVSLPETGQLRIDYY